jgi:hypothetical protein
LSFSAAAFPYDGLEPERHARVIMIAIPSIERGTRKQERTRTTVTESDFTRSELVRIRVDCSDENLIVRKILAREENSRASFFGRKKSAGIPGVVLFPDSTNCWRSSAMREPIESRPIQRRRSKSGGHFGTNKAKEKQMNVLIQLPNSKSGTERKERNMPEIHAS